MKHPDPSSAARTRAAGYAFLMITAVGWGVSWPVTKHLLTELPPLSMRGFAGLIGAATLAVLAMARGERLGVPRQLWPRLFVTAVLAVTTWTAFIGVALIWLHAGEAAVFGSFGPIWMSLLAWPLLGERFSPLRAVALLVAIGALAVLFGVDGFDASLAKLPGILFVLAATFGVALGTVLTKRFAFKIPALVLSVWQIGCGCVVVALVALWLERPNFAALSPTGWLLLGYMTFFQFCVCYACWFAALQRLPASTAGIGTLLTPVIGVIASAIALHEPLGAREIGALLLTLGSVVLAMRS